MADPLGNLLSRGFWAFFGYQAGKAKEAARDAALREREHQKHLNQLQREHLRAKAVRLRDEKIDAIANRVYVRLFDRLANADLGNGISIVSLVGQVELAKFALSVAEDVRRELRRSP